MTYKPSIVDLQNEIQSRINLYEFAQAHKEAAFASPDFQNYAEKRFNEDEMSHFADLWEDARDKTEMRLDILDLDQDEASHDFGDSRVRESHKSYVSMFYTHTRAFIPTELSFQGIAEEHDFQYSSMSEHIDDYPESAIETLERIEQLDDKYREFRNESLIEGY